MLSTLSVWRWPKVSDTFQQELLDDLALLEHRPYAFVMWAFPWGEKDTELETQDGPDAWQVECLQEIEAMLLAGHCDLEGAIKFAIKSGHGVGKSAFLSWVIWWAVATKVGTRGRVTANTEKQLRTILWSELAKWHRLSLINSMFKVTATAIYSTDPAQEKNWRIDAIPWSVDNPEAFAGLHNYGKRIIIVYDEASGTSDKIWEVTDGATTDANTEILWVVASNPTRNYGRYRECFREGSGWVAKTVDARDSARSNKNQIQQWADRHGEDSDFFRVRVRGEFPNASELQLIPVETITGARYRHPTSQMWEPLILAVDIARFGNNENVASFRRGKDARSLPAQKWSGLTVIETAQRVAGLITTHSPDAVMVDEGGVGGGVVDYLRHLGFQILAVSFGGKAGSNPGGVLVGNKRAEMYVLARDWLREGGAIEDSDELQEQLVAIEYHYQLRTSAIILTAKEDMRTLGKPSPDWADSFAMTFAFPVVKRARHGRNILVSEYDPLSHERMMNVTDMRVN